MPIDLPESILTILNDGKDVLQTNYWDTEPALSQLPCPEGQSL